MITILLRILSLLLTGPSKPLLFNTKSNSNVLLDNGSNYFNINALLKIILTEVMMCNLGGSFSANMSFHRAYLNLMNYSHPVVTDGSIMGVNVCYGYGKFLLTLAVFFLINEYL